MYDVVLLVPRRPPKIGRAGGYFPCLDPSAFIKRLHRRVAAWPAAMPAAVDVSDSEARVQELEAQAERLRLVAETAASFEEATRATVEKSGAAVDAAEASVQSAVASIEQLAESRSSSKCEVSRARSGVGDAAAVVEEAQRKFRRLGGTSDEHQAPSDVSDGASSEASASALKTLTDRELGEVKRLPNPPKNVRRALELVQAMLAINEAGEMCEALPFSSGEVPWAELQRMLTESGFIRRVLAIKPLPLSLRPDLLEQIGDRWPSLRDAVGLTKQSSKSSWKSALKKAKSERRKSADGQEKGGRFRAVAAAAVAEVTGAPASEPAMTVEAVEYASRPCGAIFRFCANCVSAAQRLADERRAAQTELESAQKRLDGLKGALLAVENDYRGLDDEEARRDGLRKSAEAELAKACDKRLDAKVEHTTAARALEEARRAADTARQKAAKEAEALARRREENERGQQRAEARDAEKRRREQEEIERDLATRHELVWIREHALKEGCDKPIEFADVGASTLPIAANAMLTRLARELNECTPLKLHIAGHVQPDEDPKISSLRAQAVGGALIALGVLPLRLRAKGYGSTVMLSSTNKIALRLKSHRRVTLHALAEVCTQYGCEFDSGSTVIGEAAAQLLADLARLLANRPEIRLSVEAHCDNAGDSGGNARLSLARAQAVAEHLEGLGVAKDRMTPHGFGAAFPCAKNETEAGRRKNRRVEFLVIPNVASGKGEH